MATGSGTTIFAMRSRNISGPKVRTLNSNASFPTSSPIGYFTFHIKFKNIEILQYILLGCDDGSGDAIDSYAIFAPFSLPIVWT